MKHKVIDDKYEVQQPPPPLPINYPSAENFDDDYASELSRPPTSIYSWPPAPGEDAFDTATASPLYVPPPETQHFKSKPIPSRSAPELTTVNLNEHNAAVESCSDSYTSTCTTTTTTSEEYMRMYHQQHAAAVAAAIDQSASEIDYSMDCAEVTDYNSQQYGSFSSGTTDLMSVSGRRSVQECADTLSHVVDTTQLVKYLKALTPVSVPPLPSIKPIKKVEFAEPAIQAPNLEGRQTPDVKPLELSSIPNHPPKEWKSQMVQALTTASDEAYVMATNGKSDDHGMFGAFSHVESVPLNVEQQRQQQFYDCTAPFSIADHYSPYNEHMDASKALTSSEQAMYDCKKPFSVAEHYSPYNEHGNECFAEQEEVCEPICVRKTMCPLKEAPPCEFMTDDQPPCGAKMTQSLTVATPETFEWSHEMPTITLPTETQPYFPPPICMKPYQKEDTSKKSPFLNALITTPFRSFTPFDHDVITQLEDLPTPKEKLNFIDALTVAPTEPVHKLNQELPAVTDAERQQMAENERIARQQEEVKSIISHTIETKMDQQLSAFAKVSGFRSVQPFRPMAKAIPVFTQLQQQQPQPTESCQTFATTNNTAFESHHEQNNTTTVNTVASTNVVQSNNYSSKDHSANNISFPPPIGVMCKSYVQSGLHKPEMIPKYQRQWFNLASQSPVRTPEPHELKENVPLAFIELPHEDAQKPVAISIASNPDVCNAILQHQHHYTAARHEYDAAAASAAGLPSQQSNVDRCQPNPTMQSATMNQQHQQHTDSNCHQRQSTESACQMQCSTKASSSSLSTTNCNRNRTASPAARPRSQTPSLINKPAATVPYYQQCSNLVGEECNPTNSLLFDPRVTSPMPDRCPSPAPGPPPNPLRVHAPRVKSPEPSEYGSLLIQNQQPGPILTTSNSTSYNKSAVSAQKSSGMSHYQSLYQTGAQQVSVKPEVVQQQQIGNTHVHTRSNESQMNQEQKSKFESATTTQMGNVQVQRKTRVVEEFEHTQKAKSMEIYKSTGGSGSAAARSITASQGTGAQNFASYKNNQEVAQQASAFSSFKNGNAAAATSQEEIAAEEDGGHKVGFVARQARRLSTNSQYTADLATYQSKFPHMTTPTPTTNTFPIKSFMPVADERKAQSYSVNNSRSIADSVSSSATMPIASCPPPGYQQIQPNLKYTTKSAHQPDTANYAQEKSFASSSISTSSSALTSSTTANSNNYNNTNQSSTAVKQSYPISVARPSFKPPTAVPVPAFNPTPVVTAALAAVQQQQPAYQPTASTGPTGFKPPQAPITTKPQLPLPTNKIPSAVVSDPNPASAGANKGLTFGATSAPKRGRGVLNNPGSGGRIPQCGCCNAQIR